MAMFSTAPQPEIIRSNQKDDYYQSHLRSSLTSVVQAFLGPRFWIKWRREVDVAGDLGYFALTTLSGYQTLGEEYVGILQVDKTKRAVPTTWHRSGMVACQVLLPYLLDSSLAWLERELRGNPSLTLTSSVRATLLEGIPTLRHVIVLLHRCHLAMFYLRGVFYHIAKRIAGIYYIMVRSSGRPRLHPGYRLLGWLSILQLAILAGQQFYRFHSNQSRKSSNMAAHDTDTTEGKTAGDSSSQYVTAADKCALCLDLRRHSTATPCGHLYCWQCIADWCSTKPQCPLCRDQVSISRLIYLQNYDKC